MIFNMITASRPDITWPYGECGDLQGSVASRMTLNATFQANSSITFASFPSVSSVTSSRAFRGCYILQGAEFQILSSIPRLTFATCFELKSVSFPACETIDYGAFFYCTGLKKADFPNCTTIMSASGSLGFAVSSMISYNRIDGTRVVRSITSYSSGASVGAFERAGIVAANFPACTTIGSYAFSRCTALSSVSFPACTMIDAGAFYNCTALSSVSFPACTMIGGVAFQSCPITSAVFPNCQTVGEFAFQSCHALVTVSLPACTNISTYAFISCISLNRVNLFGASVVSLANSNVFIGTPIATSTYTGTYGSIYVPASLLTAYKTATNWVYYSDRFVGLTDEEIAAL